MKKATLYMAIPCYNEEEALPLTAPVFLEKLISLIEQGRITDDSRILFVNDGSKDRTWDIICDLHASDYHFTGVSLAHNSGEQNAMLAGMFTAEPHADCVVTMDCDLQDNINVLGEMVDRYYDGCEIVFGARSNRERDSFLKRTTSAAYYKLMTALHTGIVRQHSNYRLMSKKALGLLKEFQETDTFLPLLVASVGLKSSVVYYERYERVAGKTTYNVVKLVRLAVDGIMSFSSAPLLVFSIFAAISVILTLASGIAWIVASVRSGVFQTGLCILTSVWFISSMLCVSMRVLGEYAFKNLFETKRRPRYQIDKVLD